MPHADSAKHKEISGWRIAAFAAPHAPLLALGLPTIMFLPHHYVTELGIAGAASIFVIARVFDLLIDPMIGGIQDRTETRWGRRRFWLVLTCPVLMALTWYGFLGIPAHADFITAALTVMMLFIAFSAMTIPHLGWAGELIPTYHGRTRVLGAVQVASLFGQVAILALAAYVVQGLGMGDAGAVRVMGWTIIALLPITTLLAVVFAPERRLPPQPHITLRQSFAALLDNEIARRVLQTDLLLGIIQGVAGTLFLFYFQFVLRFESQSQTLLFSYFVAGLLGVPIWTFLSRRIGKHRALQAAFLYTAVTTALIPLMPPGNFAVVAPIMVIAGLAQGGGILLTRALMADVVDEDELRTGSRRSGLYFGLLLTTSKFGITAGPLALVLLQLMGFEPALRENNSPASMIALGVMFVFVPILMSVLAVLSLRNYPLDEARQAEMARLIAARHKREDEAAETAEAAS